MYCNQCGGKNADGSKFCSSCGKPILSHSSILNGPVKKKIAPSRRHEEDEEESDSESDSDELVIPDKLNYSIEQFGSGRQTLGSVLWTRDPVEPEARVAENYKKPSKEEFFRESTKACGPSKTKDIDESTP